MPTRVGIRRRSHQAPDACDDGGKSVRAEGEHVAETPPVGLPVPGLTTNEIDGCINIYNPWTRRAVLLNETATSVWRMIDGDRDVDAIVTSLAHLYDAAADDIRSDVITTIGQLRTELLLMDPRPAEDSPARGSNV